MQTLARIIALTAVVFTFVAFRWICWRLACEGRRLSWRLAPAMPLIVSFLMLVVFSGPDIFTRKFWHDDRDPILAVITFVACYVIAMIPCGVLVWFYREKAKRRTAENERR